MATAEQRIAKLERERERLEARIAELEAERKWRPIETAPKDGTDVLIGWFALPGQDSMEVAFWHLGYKAWCHADGLFTTDPNWQPTDWMPRPEPPPTETTGE